MANERQKEEQNLKEAFAGGDRDRGRSEQAWTALTTLHASFMVNVVNRISTDFLFTPSQTPKALVLFESLCYQG